MTESAGGMRVWGLTGLIGAGKSRVCGILADCGAEIIEADRLAHRVLEQSDIRARLIEAFGDGIISGDRIDRSRLGRRVFDDPAALDRLNRITHPRLCETIAGRLDDLRRRRPQPPLAVIEAAVYFQLPRFGDVDLVIAVSADASIRHRRLVDAGRLSADEATQRIAAQDVLAAQMRRADITLPNNGDFAELRSRVAALYDTHIQNHPDGGIR